MQKRPGLGALALTAAMLAFAAPATSHAASQDSAAPTIQVAEATQPASSSGVRPMTDSEAASAGCLLLSGASVATAFAVGASEAIMLIGGGILVPGPVTSRLAIALVATLGGAACGMGAALTPVALWAFGGDDGAAAKVAGAFGRARDSVAHGFGLGGAVQVAEGAARSQ